MTTQTKPTHHDASITSKPVLANRQYNIVIMLIGVLVIALIIGAALQLYGAAENAPAVSNNISERQYTLPVRDVLKDVGVPSMSVLDASDRYALEKHAIMPRQEVSKEVEFRILNFLDASDQYALEMQGVLPGREVAKEASAPIMNILGASDRYALEILGILPGREVAKEAGVPIMNILGASDRYTLEKQGILPGSDNANETVYAQEARESFKCPGLDWFACPQPK